MSNMAIPRGRAITYTGFPDKASGDFWLWWWWWSLTVVGGNLNPASPYMASLIPNTRASLLIVRVQRIEGTPRRGEESGYIAT